jgi:hypothetical protein
MSKNTLFIEKGAIVKFLANLESGDKRLTSWVICSGDKYNENHIVTKKEQIGTLFSYCFDQYGQYTIASYGKTEDINENSIKKIEIIDPQLIEIICTLGGKMEDGKLSVKRGAIVHFEMMYKGEKVKLKKYRIIVKLKKNDKRGDVGRVDSGVFEYNAKHLDDGKPTEYIVSVEEPKKDNNGIIYQSIEMVVIPDKEEQKQTETPNIEENKILKYDISELPEFGKLITFSIKKNEKYVNFPKKLSELDVHWEVTKNGKFMKGGTGFLFCYSFQEEGNFQVRCYICDKEIEAKEEYNIIQPKIFPKSAKWVDRDGTSGNIIETAGYYQKIYAYIEHEMLQEEKVSLYIYDKETDQLLHTEEGIRVTHKKNICIPFMLKKDPNIPTKETIQIYFKIKAENTDKLSIKNSEDKIEKYLTITNRGDVVDAYFCDADDTKIYRAIEEGTVKNLHFKLYMTNMLKREVEILFYIFKPFPTTIPAKDCLNWVHWEKIASHFSKKQPFHTTKAIVNNKGEILVKVPTSKLIQIGDFTSVVAVFKIMGSDGKVKGAYLERRNALMLFSNKALTHMKENFAPVKVLLEKVNNKVLRQEIGKESVDENTIYITRKWEKRITSYKKEDDNHAYSATYGTFVFGDITGFICEPYGPETTESEQDQRIPIGTYNLEWHPKSGRFPKNVYTKEGRYVKKQGYSPNYINFPELNKGIIRIYNKDVPKGRGILLHAGFYGIWTEGCINPFRTLSEKIRDLNIELKESVELLFEIYDKIDKIGIEKVKIVIVDEIDKPKSKEDEKYGEIIKKRYR